MNRARWDTWRQAPEGKRKAALFSKIFSENEPFALQKASEFIARSQFHLKAYRDDIEQAARIGLIRAIKEWDPARGAFSTIAGFWVRHEMQLVVRHVTPISRPRWADPTPKEQAIEDAVYARRGRYPTKRPSAKPRAPVPKFMADTIKPSAGAGFRPFTATDDARRANTYRGLQVMPAAEEHIDRKRDVEALNRWLKKLSAKDRKAFWAGNRADLTAAAKTYVEEARNG